jgi:hypothetical protein
LRKRFDGIFKSIEKLEFEGTTMEGAVCVMTSKARGSLCLSALCGKTTFFSPQRHEVSQRETLLRNNKLLKIK